MRFRLASFLSLTAAAGLWLALPFALSLADSPDTTRLAPGATLDTLTIGKTTYQQVRIRTISAQTVMIQHAGGIASLRLAELSPELQQQFGYDPAAAQSEAEKQKAAAAAAELRRKELATRAAAVAKRRPVADAHELDRGLSNFDRLLRRFGDAPELSAKVDLRSRYNELGLWVKSQGARPSCSVFAIVSALEFQSAELNGQPERFSEEYLLWATRKMLKRAPRVREGDAASTTGAGTEPFDEGFALQEVVTALRTYGIPARDRVPNRFAGATIEEPGAEIIEEARNAHRVSVHTLPGHDGATLVQQVVHALNAGIPVPVGMAWPVEHNWRTGYLDRQRTYLDRGHAVTIVGYKCESGRLEDAVFTFKNSWGTDWGVDGYGNATYAFLEKNLHSAVVLEVSGR
jgi:hypothetical protein